MATRDFDPILSFEEEALVLPKSFLPQFPDEKLIQAAFPEIPLHRFRVGKAYFLSWIDFSLEHPDEIWESGEWYQRRVCHYITFLGADSAIPAFAVEVYVTDDIFQVHDYSLIVDDSELAGLRSGKLVYSMLSEWQRENLVKFLNDRALNKYDEDLLDEARELIDAAIRLSGSASAYLLNNRGLISWKMGNTNQAKNDFLESISLDRNNGDPYFNVGLIYFDESDHDRALHYLKRAVEINPMDSQFLTELGHLYLEMEYEDEALSLFRKAFEKDPEDPQVDFHLGHYFLYKKRQPRHALRYYHKGLKKDPNDQFALADFAVAHLVLGNRRKALQIHRLLQSKARLMPYTISRLVYLSVEMGNYENALKYYRKAMSHEEPFEPEWLHYNAAVVYANTGRAKQALDILDLAVRVGGDAVLRRALSDKSLEQLKTSAHFKRLVKLSTRRRNR